jgi:nucleoside phosphorylase
MGETVRMKLDDAATILGKADEDNLRRVLVITALPLEMEAVRAQLDPIGSGLTHDGEVLEFGKFTGTGVDWLVVVAESGAGNDAAQAAVSSAFRMGPFELVILVGVAASRKKDVPIGSVVISNHVYSSSGGKFEDGVRYARAREFQVNTKLVGLAKKTAREGHWHERLHPPYGGTEISDEKYPRPFPPRAVIAPIVSVDAVSADPDSTLERHITQTYQDATALEMEGYGAHYAAFREETPCVVVRGISDTRGGKVPELDAIHQPIAAGHATAFALELLNMWGQNYPGRDRKETYSRPADTAAAPDTMSSVPAAPSQPQPRRVRMVLNFQGEANDYTLKRQGEILEVVREVTGDLQAQIVLFEGGSFHLFIDVAEADREKLDNPKLARLLAIKSGVALLGVLTEGEYQAARQVQPDLLAASAALLNWPQSLPDGTRIERPELEQLKELVDKENGSTTAVLGLPGSGKTALLASLADWLGKKGTPFLAIKADMLDSNVGDEESLRDALGLAEKPSVTLARLSMLGPVVLIIDQLDALASYVDLKTGRLSALLNIVRKLGARPNLHVVLSARSFEYEHDSRLRSVQAESLTLSQPPWTTVRQILEQNGVQAAGWPSDAQEELRSPQSLSTFLKLSDRTTAKPFDRYHAMLEHLWQNRILSASDSGRVAKLAGDIAEEMADRETLWLATAKFDDRASDIRMLISVGILTYTAGEKSLGFSHQTVFEFVLARAFAQKEGRLSTFILSKESSLFVRPKLWAALTYLRGAEQVTYETELNAIWAAPALRLHLRHLVIEFLGQQPKPTETEAVLLEDALRGEGRAFALRAVIGSPGWFVRLQHAAIPAAMTNKDETNVAAGILSRAAALAPTDVLALVKAKWLPRAIYDGYTWSVLQDIPEWDEQVLSAASTILQRTEIASFALDHALSTLGVSQPDVALKLALVRLNKLLDEAMKEADRRAALPPPEGNEHYLVTYHSRSPRQPLTNLVEQSDGWDALEALAKKDAASFMKILWPWFQTVLSHVRRFERDEDEIDRGFVLSHLLDYRFAEDQENMDLGEQAILGGFRTAAEVLAAQEGDAFVTWLSANESNETQPAQRLFAHALASQPQRYASRALEFLLADKRRFQLGNIEDFSATSKRLVREVSPHWSDSELSRFIGEINAYSPQPASWRDPKQRQNFYRDVDRLKLELFEELPEARLSDPAKNFIKEQRRRLGESRRGAEYSGPTWIGSPMSADEIGKADDEDVLNAFRQLPDATGWDNPKTWMKGGNIQLSRAFADFAKANPERAKNIIAKFEPRIGSRAAGYALEAMSEAADPQLILRLIVDLEQRGFLGEEYRGGTARAIERLIRRGITIDDHVLSLITGWLGDGKNAPPEEKTEAEQGKDEEEDDDNSLLDTAQQADSAEKRHETSVLWGMRGVSTLPHGNFPILETLTRIYLQRRTHEPLLQLLIDHLDRADQEQVWAAMLQWFQYIRPDDKTLLTSFLSKLFEKYPGLATTREAAMLLARIHWIVPDFVRSILEQSQGHSSPLVQQAFGELSTLIWLVQPSLDWPAALVEDLMAGKSAEARMGAAYAAVNVWGEIDEKDSASNLLQRLVKSREEPSWLAVWDLFRLVDEITPEPPWTDLLDVIADHIADHGTVPATYVVQSLETLLPHKAQLVAKFAKALVTTWRQELGDIQTGVAAAAPELVNIAITLHRLGPETRELGTSLFEDLLQVTAYTAKETLNQIDNRFESSTRIARPRLPRRRRNAGRRARRAA